MALLKNLNQFIAAIFDTFRNFGRVKIWGVLLGYFLIVALVLYAHYNFLSPLFYGLIRTSTALISGDLSERFYHYPSHFLLMPWFFGWAKLIIGILLEGLFLGMAAMLFYRYYLRMTTQEAPPLRSVLSLWPQLFLVSLIFNGLVTGLSLLIPTLMADYIEGSPRRLLLLELGIMPAVYIILTALFFLAIPVVAIYRRPFYAGIGRSLRFFARRPFTPLFMAFFILIVPIVVSYFANKTETVVEKFHPELVVWLLFAGLVADLIANFFWMGTAVRFLVDDEA